MSLVPEGVVAYNPTPYYNCEIGVDEPAHPDRDIAARFVEIATSTCKYGCKIYADPYTEIRALVHSSVYGCRTTMEDLAQREEGEIRAGDTVEFSDIRDPLITRTGKVLNLLPPDGWFEGGYHVACYYVITRDDVVDHAESETYQQAYDRLSRTGIVNEEQIASYLKISVETLRALHLDSSENLVVDGTEFKAGDVVCFRDFENPQDLVTGVIRRYLPPEYDEDHPFGGYVIGLYEPNREIVIFHKNKLSLFK